MKKINKTTRRKYKVNRNKISPIDNAYNSYSKMWSKTFGKDAPRMSEDQFILDAHMRGVNLTDSAELMKAAQQRVASAASQLTSTQAKNLKREILALSDVDLESMGKTRAELKKMTIEEYKNLPKTDKAMISAFYEVLKEHGLMAKEAGQWISAEIYGS